MTEKTAFAVFSVHFEILQFVEIQRGEETSMKKIYLLAPLLAFFFLLLFTACEQDADADIGHTHSFGNWEISVPPTCTEKGVTRRTCACGTAEETDIPALGHDISRHPAQEATCAQNGWEAYETCSRCDYSTYREIEKTAHDFVEHEAKEPTCTQDGWTAYKTCKNCSYSSKKTAKALGHDWNPEYTVDIEPTYESVGLKSHHCNRCSLTRGAIQMERVTKGYIFYLVGGTGSQLNFSCEAEIYDESGAPVCEEQFTRGICGVDLEPGNYRIKLKEIPFGFFAQDVYEIGDDSMVQYLTVSSSVIENEPVPENKRYKVGDVLYDFTAHLEGKSYKLSELVKQYDLILLNFWATWCGPCMAEMPMLQEAYSWYTKSVFVMALSIEPTDTAAKIETVKREKGLTFPVGSDRENGLWKYFDTGAIPTCVYIDRNGIFVSNLGFEFQRVFAQYAKPDNALETSAAAAKMLQGTQALLPKRDQI